MTELKQRIVEIPEEYRPGLEDLPGELSRIAAVIEQHKPGHGVELTLFLAQAFRGQNIYLRSIDYLIREIRDDAIRTEYDQGKKVKTIALDWQLSTRWVEDILARAGRDVQERQGWLF